MQKIFPASSRSAPKTVYDVGREAGVSIATVSRVFAGIDVVRPSTRTRVLKAADRIGFQPNQSARRLAGSKSALIGFLASYLNNPLYLDYFHALEAIARPKGYEVLIADSELSYEREWEIIQRMRMNQVEALMIFPVGDIVGPPPAAHRKRVKALTIPCLLLGLMRGVGFPVITVDERRGASELALGLWQRGWRNIIYAHALEKGNRPGFEREDSLRQTWISLTGKTSAFRSVTLDTDDRNSLRALVASWKSAPERTVLVTVNEETAYPLYGPLSDAGISLPADIGLASFGALKMAEYFRPRLTLVVPDHAEIARESAETLFQMIAGKFPAKSPRLFPCRIAWRESTGDVPEPPDKSRGTREPQIV